MKKVLKLGDELPRHSKTTEPEWVQLARELIQLEDRGDVKRDVYEQTLRIGRGVVESVVDRLDIPWPGPQGQPFVATRAQQWAQEAFTDYKPLILRAISAMCGIEDPAETESQLVGDDAELAAKNMVKPIMTTFGALALRSYELSIARSTARPLLIRSEELNRLAQEWEVDPDATIWAACALDAIEHVISHQPALINRISSARNQFLDRFDVNPKRLGGAWIVDLEMPNDPKVVIPDIEEVLSAFGTPEQTPYVLVLTVHSAVVRGIVVFVATSLAKDEQHLRALESLLRHKPFPPLLRGMVGTELGVPLDPALALMGGRFVRAVVDAKGVDGLRPIWDTEDGLPVPSEISDPTSWLGRMET